MEDMYRPLEQDEFVEIVSGIDVNAWKKIIENEPEWGFIEHFYRKYDFGRLLVLMMATGLNDYALKKKAEDYYWSDIKDTIDKNRPPL